MSLGFYSTGRWDLLATNMPGELEYVEHDCVLGLPLSPVPE